MLLVVVVENKIQQNNVNASLPKQIFIGAVANASILDARLDTIDTYSLLGIFDNLNIEDLINLADVNVDFHEMIRHHYMIGIYQIDKLRIRFDEPTQSAIYSDSFIIGKFDVAEKFLRHFGDLITQLEYSNNPTIFKSNEADIIDRYIEQYCSPTLNHIDLINAGRYLVTDAKQPFTNVISVGLMQFASFDKLALNRIFPNMQRLQISINYPIDLTAWLQEYPHLCHLDVIEWGDPMNNTALLDLLQLNSNVRALALNNFPQHLQQINDHLPNLKALTLKWDYVNDLPLNWPNMPIVHFKNVTEFHLNVRAGTLYANALHVPVTFERLEVLDIVTTHISPPIRTFIEQNKQLTQISVPALCDASQFLLALETISEHSKLRVITIRWMKGFNTQSMQRLCEIDSLKKMKLVVEKTANLDDVRNAIPNEWKIYDVISSKWLEHLTIVRK